MTVDGRLRVALLAVVALVVVISGATLPREALPPDTALDAAISGAVSANVEPGPKRLAVSGISSDGVPPAIAISTLAAYQGGAILVSARWAAAGSVTFLGRTYALLPQGSSLVAFVGVGVGDSPGPTSLALTVQSLAGAMETRVIPVVVQATDWTVDHIILPPGVGAGLTPAIVQAEEDRLAAIYGGLTPVRWSGKWISPVDPATPISGYFGEQRSFNGGPVGGHHGGTDFGATEGTPVIAANAGVVVLSEELAVRGNMVIVDHGGGVFSGYSHFSQLVAEPGQVVGQGDLLGYVGTTGLSSAPHLHWEVAVGGVLVDGLRWLDGTQGF